MDRRAMVLAAVLAGGLPVAARAQPRLRRIGWLGHTAIDTPDDERVHAPSASRSREPRCCAPTS